MERRLGPKEKNYKYLYDESTIQFRNFLFRYLRYVASSYILSTSLDGIVNNFNLSDQYRYATCLKYAVIAHLMS